LHLLLTDRLICPRCGPGFGLILLADRLENRRVIEGSLGCPNCRDRFPIEEGFGDLRPPPRSTRGDAPHVEPPASPPAIEVAALLGLSDGSGNVALIGDLAGHATGLAGLVPGVEFIGIAPGLRGWEEGEGLSRMTAGAALPFSSGSLRGVGLFAAGDPSMAGGAPMASAVSMAGELCRVVTTAGRIAVWGEVEEWEKALISEGLEVLASEESALVVTRTAR
jgi:uncharacterized protein YbaR (Trm112 family)